MGLEYKETGSPYYPAGVTERDIDGPEEQRTECLWTETVDRPGYWDTDCGDWARYLGSECDPSDFKVCPFCEKKLVIIGKP